MAVQVNEVKLAKSGKCYNVTLSGEKYLANLDSGLNANVGRWIEAEIKQSKDPKYPSWIGKWTFVSSDPQSAAPQVSPPPPVPPSAAPVAAAPRFAEPSDNIQPWYMPFVSNTVAHAIEKGLCTTPEAINQWALKAAQVAVAVKTEVK